MKMKVEVEIYEMKAGKITALKIDDDIFFVTKSCKQQTIDEELVVSGTIKIPEKKEDKKDFFNDVISQAKDNTISYNKFLTIAKSHGLHIPKKSVAQLVSSYRSEFRDEGITIEYKKRGRYKNYHKKVADGVAYIKTYNRWVTQDEITLVKKSLSRYGEKNITSMNIVDNTRLKRHVVLSVLYYLIHHEGKVKKHYNDFGEVIYSLVPESYKTMQG
jgi:hypothetical protein